MASHVLQHRTQYGSDCSTLRIDVQNPTLPAANKEQRALAVRLSHQTADEYKHDIVRHMHYMESQTLPAVSCVNALYESYWPMRFKLLEFLVQIHSTFQLPPEDMFLAVNLLDRYCCRKSVRQSDLQLLGCTALLIAAKYGDGRRSQVPSLEDLCSACCSLYDTAMFTEMEWSVLEALSWAIGHPDSYTFLQMALAESTSNPQVIHLSMYIAETALFYKEFVCTKPSVLSKTALALAFFMLARWSIVPSFFTYDYDAHTLANLLRNLFNPPQVLVIKYGSKQFSHVSTIVTNFFKR